MSTFDDWAGQEVQWLLRELGDEVYLFDASGEQLGPVQAILSASVFTEEIIDEGEGVQVVVYERKRVKIEPPDELQVYATVTINGTLFDVESLEDSDTNMVTLLVSRRVRIREHRRDIFR